MTILQAIILGIVQGLTEFLPISSSAHLVFVPYLLNWNIDTNPMFVFNVLVQLGTLAAVIVYFRNELWKIIKDFFVGVFSGRPFSSQESKMGWFLILATIPAGLLGLLIKDQVEQVFASPTYAAVFLIVTAVLLLIGEKISTRRRTLKSFTWIDSIIMGLFQAVAIFPGISRSGATISGGLMRKLDRPSAAKFSFLMSVPIMLAAGLLGILDMLKISNLSVFLPKMIVGFFVAGIIGYFVIKYFMKLISKVSLLGFAIYCAAAGLIVLILSLLVYPAQSINPTSVGSTDETINIQVPSSLGGFSTDMNRCAQEVKGLSIQYIETDAGSYGPDNSLILQLKQADAAFQTYQVGTEDLIFIINNQNEIAQITKSELSQIFMGTAIKWQETDRPIEVYTYPTENDIQQIFLAEFMRNAPVTTLSHLVFTPQEMLRFVSADSAAIGMIPGRFLDSSVKQLNISDLSGEGSSLPILASTQMQLSDKTISFIDCLQKLP